jgi:hypothetical protein
MPRQRSSSTKFIEKIFIVMIVILLGCKDSARRTQMQILNKPNAKKSSFFFAEAPPKLNRRLHLFAIC